MKRAATVLFAVLLVGCANQEPVLNDRTLGIVLDNERGLSIEETKALVRRLDALADSLPVSPGIKTREDLDLWADEIVPYMEYEHVSSPAVYPTSLEWFLDANSRRAFHVLGTAGSLLTGCGPIEINGRVANPVSSWYGREDVYITLIHELVHVQGGIFCTGPSEQVEADTQIATMEIGAAMVNHGNLVILRPWLVEMADMGLATLQFYLSADEYEAFRREINPGALHASQRAKSLRYWESNPQALRDILYKYNVVPWGVLTDAALSGWMVRYPTLTLPADDLSYLLAHAGELVSEGMQA